MKKAALIYALWDKNLPVLKHYLAGRLRTVIVPGVLATTALREVVESANCELLLLPTDGSVYVAETARAVCDSLKVGPSSIGLANDDPLVSALEILPDMVQREFPAVQGWLSVLESALEDHEIEATVLNEDVSRDSKMLALWSRHKRIPVLQVAHGTGMGRNYIGEVNLSDHIAVPSARSAEYFADLGAASDNLHVVGNAALDVLPALTENRATVRATIAQANSLPYSGHWIVWGSTWNAGLSALDDRDDTAQIHEACQTFADLLSKRGVDATVIYKDRLIGGTQFEDARDRFMEVASRYGVAGHAHYSASHALEWVASADVVVSYDSNLAIEALLCGTPSINVLSPFGAIVGGAFGADDGVLTVETEQVAATIARLFDDAKFRALTMAVANSRKSYFQETDGTEAATRTAAVIERIALRPASTEPAPSREQQRLFARVLMAVRSATRRAAPAWRR